MSECPNCLAQGSKPNFCQECFNEHGIKFLFIDDISELGE